MFKNVKNKNVKNVKKRWHKFDTTQKSFPLICSIIIGVFIKLNNANPGQISLRQTSVTNVNNITQTYIQTATSYEALFIVNI